MHGNNQKSSPYQNNFSEAKMVNTTIPVSQRENSDFHFLLLYPLPDLDIVQTQEESESVIYCGPKKLGNSQEMVFPNHNLAKQNRSLPHHLNIPKITKEFTTHITLIYIPERYHEEQGEFIVVHINCTPHAMSQSVTAHAYSYHAQFHRIGLGRKIPMSDQQQASARRDASPIYKLFQTILNKKAEVYVHIYQHSFQIDYELAELQAQKADPVLIHDKALELQKISNNLSLLHGTQRDGRANFISRLLLNLETPDVELARLSIKDTGNTLTSSSVQINNNSKSTPKKPQVKAHTVAIQHSKTEIQQQIHKMSELSAFPLTTSYVEEWLQLELLIDQLLLVTPSREQIASKHFISQQRTFLSLQKSLLEHFLDCIKSGDVHVVKTMFPIIDCRYDLSSAYDVLIKHLMHEVSNPLLLSEWPQIGQFFYEHSELFRSKLQIVLNNTLLILEDDHTEGFAFRCFISNHIQAFQLAMKVFCEESPQLLAKDNQYFGLLEAIIRNYSINPNVQFIQILLSVLGNIRVMPISTTIVKTTTEALKNSSEFKKIQNNISKQFQSESTLTSKDLNAFELASALKYEVYPELMQELAPYASLASLTLVYAEIVNAQCMSRLIFGPQPMLVCTANQTACHLMNVQIDSSSNTQTRYCCFLFYPNEAIVNTPKAENVSLSLQAVSKSFQAFLSRESEDIAARDMLLRKAMHYLSATENGHHLLAAQFCYGFINQPTIQDHEAMLRLFALRGKRIVAQSRNPTQLYLLQMSPFLNMLTENSLRDLGCRPIYEFVIKKLPAELQKRYLQYVPKAEKDSKLSAPMK